MRHTLKASFDQQIDAEHLLDDLLAAGHTAATMAMSGATHSGHFTRQRHAVTLVAESDLEAQSALGIIERSAPARIEDVADENEPGFAPQAPPAVRTYPPGAAPGSLQFRPLDEGHIFGTQNADAPPRGNTFQETMGAASQWNGADEYTIGRQAQTPHDDAGGGYRMDDSEARGGGAGAGMGTDGVAGDAGEPSAWHKIMAAVRHGWDRVMH